MWIDLEMGRRAMLERLRALGLVDEQISDGFLFVQPDEPLTDEVRGDLDGLLGIHSPVIVVIDSSTPALELHGFDPMSGRDVQGFQRAVIEPLRQHGAAILQLDHLTKAKDRRGRFAVGSERKLGVADVHLGT
jgi:hypothetical protein